MYDFEPNSSRACFNFSVQTFHDVQALKISLSLIAIIANLLVICFIIYSKKFKDFMYRLVLYLMAIDILQAVAVILIEIPVTVPSEELPAQIRSGKAWNDTCVATGFISMTTMWMGNIIIFWIVIYIVWLGWCLYRHVYRKRGETGKNIRKNDLNQHRCTRKEIFGVLVMFVAPFAIASLPLFIDDGKNMYGLSGLWCWIKTMNDVCGDLGNAPLAFELVFYYGPLMIIALLAIVFMFISFICYCRGEVRRHEKIIELKQRHMKEILIVLACPLVYCSICMLLFINRIYSTVESKRFAPPYKPLWLAHAVADPVRLLLPALAFICNPYVWKDARSIRNSRVDETRKVGDSEEKRSLTSQGYTSSKRYGAVNNDVYVSDLIDN